jgi:hypothetical protein
MPASIDKVCRTDRAFVNELFVYESAFPHKPKLIEIRNPRTLVLSKVEGTPYLDVPELTADMISMLAKVISILHSTTHLEDRVLCHWDNQPRNILWDIKKQRFCLVDFEDIRLAPPEADILHLFLFWAEVMDFVCFSHKVLLFLSKYKSAVPLNQNRWKKELRKAKSRFDSRRQKHNKKEPITNPDRLTNRKYLASKGVFLLFPQH